MKKIPYLYITKWSQFNRFSRQINRMIKDGSFFSLSSQKRNELIRRLKRLYDQLLKTLPELDLKRILAAAVFVLGLSIGTAFSQSFGPPQTDPFGLSSSAWNFPTIVDIDGDGDFDIFTGNYGDNSSSIQYYENIGNNISPSFAIPQKDTFGLSTTDTLGLSIAFPTFVDIDGDGDFDAFIGVYGNIQYFENTGTSTSPSFTTPITNPFGLISTNTYALPVFVDIDNDGDYDAFVGEYNGNIQYFENTGSATAPSFTTPQINPFGLTSGSGNFAAPAFADIDGDGDIDLFAGSAYGGDIIYFENTGSVTIPSFATPKTNPFGLTNVNILAFPAFSDIDGDGDIDLFVGEYGSFQYFENVTAFNDLGVVSIDAPVSGCGLSFNESVTVTIKNFGINSQINPFVSYNINGTGTVTQSVTASITPGNTFTYTFTTPVDLSATGAYILNAWTNLPTDQNNFNDSTYNYTVTNSPTFSTFPYSENFESGNGSWISDGTNSSWTHGTPSGFFITGAASGSNAWVTNLSGSYNDNEYSYLISPCFDFSTLTLDPYLRFSHIFTTEPCCDKGWVEYSIDGGTMWTKLGTSSSGGTNWYNDVFNDWWDGSSGISDQWITARHDLTGVAGQTDVRVRFVFSSDVSVTYEGFGVDDIFISEPLPNDVGVITIDAPISGCGLGINESVIIRVKNFGSNVQSTIPVSYNLNEGTPVNETLITTLNPGDTASYTFTTTADLSDSGIYLFDAWTALGTDQDSTNDSTLNYSVIHPVNINTFPYIEDFDSELFCFSGCVSQCVLSGDWINATNDDMDWDIVSGQYSSSTGPVVDHTTGSGQYAVTHASSGCYDQEALFLSPCIDITALTNPYLTFWHHMYGISMGNLYIDIFSGSTWTTIDSIIGQQQTSQADPWLVNEIDLSSYSGIIQVRFRGVTGSGYTSDMAIDDISITNILLGIPGNKFEENNIKVYPNPAENEFNVVFNGMEDNDVHITVMDLQGRTILYENISVQNEFTKKFDISSLPIGMYFIKIRTSKNFYIVKIVIE